MKINTLEFLFLSPLVKPVRATTLTEMSSALQTDFLPNRFFIGNSTSVQLYMTAYADLLQYPWLRIGASSPWWFVSISGKLANRNSGNLWSFVIYESIFRRALPPSCCINSDVSFNKMERPAVYSELPPSGGWIFLWAVFGWKCP